MENGMRKKSLLLIVSFVSGSAFTLFLALLLFYSCLQNNSKIIANYHNAYRLSTGSLYDSLAKSGIPSNDVKKVLELAVKQARPFEFVESLEFAGKESAKATIVSFFETSSKLKFDIWWYHQPYTTEKTSYLVALKKVNGEWQILPSNTGVVTVSKEEYID